ncbi:NAD(P)H-hydrate epimerase [Anaerovorax sp. IOR16]|uniref:NAD(P)H-hydrate epimerase n=1 Tax=Anaerovorax sp. IOR16 TaxID=2773458 RepID=UPI001AD8FCD4|nr:NAD(P)H-hydrate epimerase [Anaerovorax sp. IOR16]
MQRNERNRKKADEEGLSYRQMMENAGTAAAKVIFEKSKDSFSDKNNIVIFCGKGNNGGDGFVVGRYLLERNQNVTMVLADGQPKTEDAIANAAILSARGISMIDAEKHLEILPQAIKNASVIIDAIYGTGFHGNLNDTVRMCARLINETAKEEKSRMKNKVFSLDIPTGLNGDYGQPDVDTVIADKTIVFHRLKPVHKLKEVIKFCGEIIVVGIGID